jgi:predicted GNAT family acetyltransferase
MAWTLTDSLDDYLAGAGDYLRADPVQHTVELAATERMLVSGADTFGAETPVFGWWRATEPDAPISAVCFHTPPYPLLLSGAVQAVAPLAAALASRRRSLPGVNGPAELAEPFAEAWQEQTGVRASVERRSRLYELDQLIPPDPMPPGRARLATQADADLLAAWFTQFALDIGEVHGDPQSGLRDQLSFGGLTLWESDGIPVSMAGHNRPAAGVIRVGPVYTPATLRGRGYGGAVTVAISQAALDRGATVILFTDLANPTSNELYARLGYVPVGDRLVLAFSERSGS